MNIFLIPGCKSICFNVNTLVSLFKQNVLCIQGNEDELPNCPKNAFDALLKCSKGNSNRLHFPSFYTSGSISQWLRENLLTPRISYGQEWSFLVWVQVSFCFLFFLCLVVSFLLQSIFVQCLLYGLGNVLGTRDDNMSNSNNLYRPPQFGPSVFQFVHKLVNTHQGSSLLHPAPSHLFMLTRSS